MLRQLFGTRVNVVFFTRDHSSSGKCTVTIFVALEDSDWSNVTDLKWLIWCDVCIIVIWEVWHFVADFVNLPAFQTHVTIGLQSPSGWCNFSNHNTHTPASLSWPNSCGIPILRHVLFNYPADCQVCKSVRYKTRTGLGPGPGLFIKHGPGLFIKWGQDFRNHLA